MGGGGGGGGGMGGGGMVGSIVQAGTGSAASIVSSAGSIVEGIWRGKAAKKALESQRKALKSLQTIDVNKYKQQANLGDKENYINRLENLRQADPELAKVRDVAISNLHNDLQMGGDSGSNKIAQLVQKQALAQSPQYGQLENQFLQRAQENLAAKGTLPPELQAELVRTGLANAGNAGLGAAPGSAVAPLLASQQIQLQQQREAQALGLANAASGLRAQQLGLLTGIGQGLGNLESQFQNRNMAGLGVANSLLPGGGLTGSEVLNLNEANRDLENNRIMALGNLRAQGQILAGERKSGLLRSVNEGIIGQLSEANKMFGGQGLSYQPSGNPLSQPGAASILAGLSQGSFSQPQPQQVAYTGGGGGGGGGGFDISSLMKMFGGGMGGGG